MVVKAGMGERVQIQFSEGRVACLGIELEQ